MSVELTRLWFRVICAWGVVGMFLCSACKQTSKTTNSPLPTHSPELFRVGKRGVTLEDFVRRYQRSKTSLSPRAFLVRWMEERVLWREAQERGFDRSRTAEDAARRAAVRLFLHRSFSTNFSAAAVHAATVRRVYEERLHEFVKPERIRVVHFLISAPRAPKKLQHSKQVKQRLQQEKQRRAQLAQRILSAVRARKPKTVQAFARVFHAFLRTSAFLHPAFWKEQQRVLKEWRRRPSKTWQKSAFVRYLRTLEAKIPRDPLCEVCGFLRGQIGVWLKIYEQRSGAVSARALQRFLGLWKNGLRRHPRILRLERLKAFPAQPTRGFNNVVEPFRKSAYALRDGRYSNHWVQTRFGLHLIFRASTLRPEKRTFAQVKDQIRQEI
ncbi:MAG: hypothetical protein AAGJ35_06935, partial [Myxococcota bacterium]